MSKVIIVYVMIAGLIFALFWYLETTLESIAWGVWPFVYYPFAGLSNVFKVVGSVISICVILFGIIKSSHKGVAMKK